MQPTDHNNYQSQTNLAKPGSEDSDEIDVEPDIEPEIASESCELAVKVSSDGMRAEVSTSPLEGVLNFDVKKLLLRLAQEGLAKSLISIEAVERLVQSCEALTCCVSEGRPPEHGAAAHFEILFEQESVEPAGLGDDGEVNYYETKHYASVIAGAPLMRRIPATVGVAGMDVYGKPVKAKNGKNLKLRKPKGSVLAEHDKNLLLAAISGHPVVADRGVFVEETLNLPCADLKSGNVHYDGSIVINGDVTSQVVLEASGDIHVKGTVENATIIAKGNITIGGGVLSESMAEDQDVEDLNNQKLNAGSDKLGAGSQKLSAELYAGIDIHAKFLNFSKVQAGRDILVKNYCLHCQMQSGRDIVVGEKGGVGSLICGTSYASRDIKINILGSPAYLQTAVTSGNLPKLRLDKDEVEAKLMHRNKEHQQLSAIMGRISNSEQPDVLGELVLDKKRKVKFALETINIWLRRLNSESQEIEENLALARAAHVTVAKTVYPNTQVVVNGNGHHVKSELGQSNFCVVNGLLVIK